MAFTQEKGVDAWTTAAPTKKVGNAVWGAAQERRHTYSQRTRNYVVGISYSSRPPFPAHSLELAILVHHGALAEGVDRDPGGIHALHAGASTIPLVTST
jgi:hypothetical protein